MARIRTIKPNFFTSEDIVALDPLARLLYIALWCEADREGRMVWKPMTFKLRYLPGDDCDIFTLCDALATRGLLVVYASESVEYAYIPTFHFHQHVNPREAASTLPEPPTNGSVLGSNLPRVRHASGTRQARVADAQVGKERKGREGKGEGSTTNQRFTTPSVADLAAYFGEIGLTEDPQRFYDYYQSKGWKVGTTPMKDWKAAARTWLQRRKAEQTQPVKPKRAPMTAEEREMIQR